MNMMAEPLLQRLGLFHHENFQLHFYYLASYFLQIHSFDSKAISLKCHSKKLARTLVLLFKLTHVERFYSSRKMRDFDSF